MKIVFCLPASSNKPTGGYKVVFEYANRLSAKGHEVTIINNSKSFARKYIGFIKNECIMIFLQKILLKIFRSKITWFSLNKKVIYKNSVYGITDDIVPDSDFVIATAIETVEPVYNLCAKKGQKICFAQGIENWNYDDGYVNYTYSLPIKYITISEWIRNRISKHATSEVVVIKNGLDFTKLYITNDIKTRKPYVVSMLYHNMPCKGSKYGIEALLKLKQDIPQLKVLMFGTPARPDELPEWINYIRCATSEQLLEIYNESAIFLCPTIDEGFGLTGAESMACGCALVSTDYKGVKEYAIDGYNAVLCEKENPDSLYFAMKMLIDNNDKRIQIAKNAVKDIKKLDWDKSVDMFENVLKSLNDK